MFLFGSKTAIPYRHWTLTTIYFTNYHVRESLNHNVVLIMSIGWWKITRGHRVDHVSISMGYTNNYIRSTTKQNGGKEILHKMSTNTTLMSNLNK